MSKIGQALNLFLTDFSSSLKNVQNNTLNLFESCAQISSSSAQMADVASEQTEKTAVVSTAIEQLSERVEEITENSATAKADSTNAYSLAQEYTTAWNIFIEARKLTLSYSEKGDFTAARENAATNAGPKFKNALQAILKLID